MRYLLCFLLGIFSFSVQAVTCAGDDVSEICELPVIKGGRCASVMYFRLYCDNSTSGCNGSCFGDTPAGHWFDMSRLSFADQPRPRWRCRCGCFAEETLFQSSEDDISGTEIIANEDKAVMVSSLDYFDETTTTYRGINGITYGAEKEKVIAIKTENGRAITLSRAHPAVVADAKGSIIAVKKAEKLQQGEFLLDAEGRSDRITAINELTYKGKMVNFNVISNDASNHFVIANDLLMGDQAWQEQLTSVESRIMYRNQILQAIRGETHD